MGNFIIILIVLLVTIYISGKKENFNSENTGLYNYFYQSYMNPYPLSLKKFFTNDNQSTRQT